MPFNYIDLFAGTGALSEGFRQLDFSPIAHIEADKDCCNTIKTRITYHYLKESDKINVYYDYICGKARRERFYSLLPENLSNSVINRKISDSTMGETSTTIKKLMKYQCFKNIDVIVGGPPCQAFSLRGRYQIDFENDNRLTLYVQYGQFLKYFRPKIFVFENVLGLLNAKGGQYFNDLRKYFSSIGYEIDYRILNASKYGVLQNRLRVIIVGWQRKYKLGFPDIAVIHHKSTTREILCDLAPLEPGQSASFCRYATQNTPYLKRFDLRSSGGYYTQHITRPHNANDLQIYRYAIEQWNNGKKRIKYTDIPAALQTQQNRTAFLDRFKVVDGEGISHTVMAHITKDGHYYIHPDINQCRSISVREAARIQSFSDDYYFEGTRSSMFRQIGNAVPPLLSSAIAKGIRKMLLNCQ